MARVFKKRTNRPIPKGAEIVTRSGERFARWTNPKGKRIESPIVVNGRGEDRIVVESGVYLAEFRDENDRLVTRSTECRNEAAARAKLVEFENKVTRRKHNVVSEEDERIADRALTPFGDVVTAYATHLEEHDQRPRAPLYVAHARTALRQLREHSRIARIGELTRDAVDAWIRARKVADAASKTLANLVGHAKAFTRWATAEGYFANDPLRFVTPPSSKIENPVRPIALEEIVRLMRSAPEAHGTFYALLASTGLRKGEALGLRIQDVTLDGAAPAVTIPAAISKARRDEFAWLRADIAERLRHHIASRGHVLPSARLFVLPKKMNVIFKRDVNRAGITEDLTGLTLHSFRKFFITALARADVSPAKLKALARHVDFQTTLQHYVRLESADLRPLLDRVPSFLPTIPAESVRATGTADAVAAKVAALGESERDFGRRGETKSSGDASAVRLDASPRIGDSRELVGAVSGTAKEWAVEDSNL